MGNTNLIINDEVKCFSYSYRAALRPYVDVYKNPSGAVGQAFIHDSHDFIDYAVLLSQMDDDDRDDLQDFIHVVLGSADNFLLYDEHGWGTFVVRQSIGTGDNSEDEFQLIQTKTVGAQSRSSERWDIIQTPIAPKIWVNSVLQTETTHYTVGYVRSGIITFVTPPGAGLDIEAEFYYRRRVRFNGTYEQILSAVNNNAMALGMSEESAY
jgi:hypothetical protein